MGVDPVPTCRHPAQPVLPPATSVPGLALAPDGRGKYLYSISPLLGPLVPLWQSGDKVTLSLLGVRGIMRNHSEPRGSKTRSARSDDIARPQLQALLPTAPSDTRILDRPHGACASVSLPPAHPSLQTGPHWTPNWTILVPAFSASGLCLLLEHQPLFLGLAPTYFGVSA